MGAPCASDTEGNHLPGVTGQSLQVLTPVPPLEAAAPGHAGCREPRARSPAEESAVLTAGPLPQHAPGLPRLRRCLLIQGATKDDAGWHTVPVEERRPGLSPTARLDVQ